MANVLIQIDITDGTALNSDSYERKFNAAFYAPTPYT